MPIPRWAHYWEEDYSLWAVVVRGEVDPVLDVIPVGPRDLHVPSASVKGI